MVPAGQGFGGMGSINDPVNCQGTITAASVAIINLNNGLVLSGTGTVALGSGTLTVNDTISGISGGSLSVYNQYVGNGGSGTFTQSGGANSHFQLPLPRLQRRQQRDLQPERSASYRAVE